MNKDGTNPFLLLDTVGFISNLPHELVESFKTTLDEVMYADTLVHVIDVSNPMWEYQSRVVYKVLDDLFPDKSYENKVIEVWNKIDLLTDLTDLKMKLSMSKFLVIPISAKEKININKFLTEIKNKTNSYFGKTESVIQVRFEDSDKVLQWLQK